MPIKCANCGFEIDPVNESQSMACPRCGEEAEGRAAIHAPHTGSENAK